MDQEFGPQWVSWKSQPCLGLIQRERHSEVYRDLTVSVDLALKTYSSILGESWRHTFHQDCEGIPSTLERTLWLLLSTAGQNSQRSELQSLDTGIPKCSRVFRFPRWPEPSGSTQPPRSQVGLVTVMERRIKAPSWTGWLRQLYGFILVAHDLPRSKS